MKAAWYQTGTLLGTTPTTVTIPLNGAPRIYLTIWNTGANTITSVTYKQTAIKNARTEAAVGTAIGTLTAGTDASVMLESNGANFIVLVLTPAANTTYRVELSGP